jgi:hypothetical protein
MTGIYGEIAMAEQILYEFYTPGQNIREPTKPGLSWGRGGDKPVDSKHAVVVKVKIGADRGEVGEQLYDLASKARRGDRTAAGNDVEFEAKEWCDPEALAESLESLASTISQGTGPV